jgi:peptidoglycan biosynthesis protein MviN/MurJ (putative lipid II flippase)
MDLTVVDGPTNLSSGIQLALMLTVVGGIPLALCAFVWRSRSDGHPLSQFALIFQSVSVLLSALLLGLLLTLAMLAAPESWAIIRESSGLLVILGVSVGCGAFALPVWWRLLRAPSWNRDQWSPRHSKR